MAAERALEDLTRGSPLGSTAQAEPTPASFPVLPTKKVEQSKMHITTAKFTASVKIRKLRRHKKK